MARAYEFLGRCVDARTIKRHDAELTFHDTPVDVKQANEGVLPAMAVS